MTKKYRIWTEIMTRKAGTDGSNQDDWYWKRIEETKTVTDSMEERDTWKKVYARNWFCRKWNIQHPFVPHVTEIRG